MDIEKITNEWKCKCGRDNSIANRYCYFCNSQIPNEILENICIEEIIIAKNSIVEKWKNRINRFRVNLPIILERSFNVEIIIFLLLFTFVAGFYWYCSEVDSKELAVEILKTGDKNAIIIKRITSHMCYGYKTVLDFILMGKNRVLLVADERIRLLLFNFKRLDIIGRVVTLVSRIFK